MREVKRSSYAEGIEEWRCEALASQRRVSVVAHLGVREKLEKEGEASADDTFYRWRRERGE
jgi:hypothetical protein